MASSGEVVGCVVTTKLVVLGLSATVLTLLVALFLGFTVAGLGAAIVLGSDFLVLAFFLVVVYFCCLGASATGSGLQLGVGVVSLTTRPLGRRGSKLSGEL
jgi:hypothetical protein